VGCGGRGMLVSGFIEFVVLELDKINKILKPEEGYWGGSGGKL